MIYKKYKAFKAENAEKQIKFANRDEEVKNLYDFINDAQVDKFALKFYINHKFPRSDGNKKEKGSGPVSADIDN